MLWRTLGFAVGRPGTVLLGLLLAGMQTTVSTAEPVPPTVGSFSPTGGPVGTEVTVNGSGFATVTAVAFHDSSASFTVDSDTLLRAIVPTGATSGPLSVTNPDGTALSDSSFTVTVPPPPPPPPSPPTLTAFSPTSSPIGTEVTVSGSGFATVTAVAFHDSGASFTVDSDTLLRAIVPTGATSGPLSVTNPDGTALSDSSFTVVGPPIVVTMTPTAGPIGTEVTVRGSRFATVIAVAFNGVAASFTVDSDTLLRATVPPWAPSGPLQITNPIGTGTSAKPFTVTPQVGYRSFCFGDSANSTPTGEKPESKLWWNDGAWWGSLWNPASLQYEIQRFDPVSNGWTSTGVAIDDRDASKGDALWDGQRLYFVSHIFTTNPGPTVLQTAARLYRFSYDPDTDKYTPDPGFPVTINGSKSETLVLEKDSTGRLWATWVEAGRVKVNHTLGDDSSWGTPFDLPTQDTDVDSDDISSIIAFGGDRIGIMWSDQVSQGTYFAVHLDADSAETWQPKETVLADPVVGPLSDDHISLKNLGGVVYAATKTNMNGLSSPLVYVSRRDSSGVWSNHMVSRKAQYHTRPILLLDPDHGLIHVLAASAVTGKEVVYHKWASLSDLVFSEGLGETFLDRPLDFFVGNITSTKQNLTSESGLLAIASDQDTRYYLHNFLAAPTVGVAPGVGPSPGRPSLVLLPGWPNPFYQSTRMRFALPSSGRARLEVFDLSGRLVRRLLDQDLAAASHDVTWDGRDQCGQSVGVGLYFARLQGPGGRADRSLVRLR
ncbi:MAG TPA: IPT/TIG domain-containing protein [Candidatus Eisenbacteria bacterium]